MQVCVIHCPLYMWVTDLYISSRKLLLTAKLTFSFWNCLPSSLQLAIVLPSPHLRGDSSSSPTVWMLLAHSILCAHPSLSIMVHFSQSLASSSILELIFVFAISRAR